MLIFPISTDVLTQTNFPFMAIWSRSQQDGLSQSSMFSAVCQLLFPLKNNISLILLTNVRWNWLIQKSPFIYIYVYVCIFGFEIGFVCVISYKIYVWLEHSS